MSFERLLRNFLVLCFCLFFCLPSAKAQPPQSVQTFEIRQDTSGVAAWPQIAAEPFAPLTQDTLSLGISERVYWVRFRVSEPLSETRQILQLANGNIDRLDVYLPSKTPGQYRYFAVGNDRPAENREISSSTWAFYLYPSSDYVYLRLSSTSALRLPVFVWQEAAFWQKVNQDYLIFGLFYGILLTAGLFYLFIYRALRDKTHLYYCFYVAGMFLYQLQVQGHARLLFNYPYHAGNFFFWLLLSGTFIASLFFAEAFLRLNSSHRRWKNWLRFLAGLSVLQGAFGVAGWNIAANQLAHLLGLIGPLSMITLALYRLRQGFRAARFYLAAWLILFCAILIWILSAYLPLPAFSSIILVPATAAEILLLAFALADRLRLLQEKQRLLQERMRHFQQLSLTDALTGLQNKRSFQSHLQECISFAHKNETPLALLILDLDNFKHYNDTYGHWEGDRVLASLGQSLAFLLRDSDSAFRYGGEEFIALLPGATQEQALSIAERIRRQFAAQSFRPSPDIVVNVTLSIGIAALQKGEGAAEFFKRTDAALYQAKNSGRNRSICA